MSSQGTGVSREQLGVAGTVELITALLQYDLTSSQFSPDGRVFQVEYAAKAVENGGTAVGLRCEDGVVLAVEKIVTNKLHEEGSQSRIHTIDGHIGMATGGLSADGNQLVSIARKEADNYREKFNEPIPIKELADRISGYIHAYTLYSAVRPFGVSVILASYNEHEKAKLYMIEPSGAVYVSCGGLFDGEEGIS